MNFYLLILLFFMLGIVTEFTTVSESYWMRDDAGFSVESIQLITYIINIAWVFRPIFGYIPDRYGHISAFLCVFFLVNGFIWLLIAPLVVPAGWTVFLLLLSEIAPTAGLTLIDVYMVRACKEGGDVIAQYTHGVRLVGKAGAAYLGSVCQGSLGPSPVFYIQAGCSLLFSLVLGLSAWGEGRQEELCSCGGPPPRVRGGQGKYLGVGEGEGTNPQEPEGGGGESIVPASSCLPTREDLFVFYRSPQFPFLAYLTFIGILPSPDLGNFYMLAGPINLPPSFFGLKEWMELASIFGPCFVWRGWTMAELSYMASVYSLVVMALPMSWIQARQNMVDETVIMLVTSLLGAFITSTIMTRFAIENVGCVPERNQGVYYALYSSIPMLARSLGTGITMVYMEYFEINHDNFEYLAEFNMACTLLLTLTLFLPIVM